MTLRIAASALFAVILCTIAFSAASSRTTEAAFPGSNGRILFIDDTDPGYKLTTMNPDGSDRQEIVTGLTFNLEPAFAGDGRTAFFRGLGDSGDGIYYVNTSPGITGGDALTLIPNTQSNYYDPAPSPDGQWVAFDHAELMEPAEIWAINIDGTGLTNLTNSPNGNEFSADWSPDGTKIAYVRQEEGVCCAADIWVMNADGTDQMNVTNTPGFDEGSPDWSPDGKRIIFSRSEELPGDFNVAGNFGPSDIAVVNADGTNYQLITDDQTQSQYDPAFSPDGTMILYNQPPSGISVSGFTTTIVVAEADGSNPVEISPPGAADYRTDWGVGMPADTLIWGDDNCSGEADPIDALLALRYDAGLSTNTGECPNMGDEIDVIGASLHPWGDVDCSGAVDAIDTLKTLRAEGGLSVSQPEGCPEINSEVYIVPNLVPV